MKKLLKKFSLILYYMFAQYLPMQPVPGYTLFYKLRYFLVRNIIYCCGDSIVVKNKCYFGSGNRLSVGSRSQLGQNAKLSGTIIIGEDVLMGPDVIIMATSHDFSRIDIPINQQRNPSDTPVNIGNDVWLGTRAIVLPGITIGDHSVVAAGAVVTKSFPPYSVIGGVPAKLLSNRLDTKASKP